MVAFLGNEIDLGDEIRDELLLAMPINPLCQEGCRGLCEVCGGNRNLSACDCKVDTVPAGAFSALRKLKLSNT